MHPRRTGIAAVLLLAAAWLGSGCAATYSAPAEPSGFLDDYEELQPGAADEAWLIYVNPSANFAAYDKIEIDIVTIRRTVKGPTDIPSEELQSLVDYLDRAIRTSLARDYEIVERGGPGVMNLRIALTEAHGSSVVADVASVAVPQMRLLSNLRKLSSGAHVFVGSAGVEAELVDSVNGKRLIAAVDRRAGGKRLRGAASTWDDVKKAFDHWAERMRIRLAQERAR